MMLGKLLQRQQRPLLANQQFSLLAPTSLFCPSQRFGIRVRVAREINYTYENDRKQLKLDMAVKRKQQREDYWRLQTQIENKYFEDLRKEMKEKNRGDMDRWRTKICNISKNAKDHIAFLKNREERTLEKMRMQDIRNMRKTIGNKLMLDGLEMEAAKSWPTLTNLAQKIEADVIVP